MAWFKKDKAPGEAPPPTAQELAADEMEQLEAQDKVPRDPHEWPSNKAKYLTFANEDDDAYGDGATSKLGPAEVAHHEDGSVSVGGKLVDNPQDYKGKPISGGIIEQLLKHADRNRKLDEEEAKAEAEAKG
jgi:hypothetical protein